MCPPLNMWMRTKLHWFSITPKSEHLSSRKQRIKILGIIRDKETLPYFIIYWHILAVKEDTLGYLHMCLEKNLSKPYTLNCPPFYPLSPFRTISTGFIILVSYVNTQHLFSLSLCPSLPLVPTPEKDRFYPPVLQFFVKSILIDQGNFTLVCQAYYLTCFNHITPPLLTLSLIFNSLWNIRL
jgi:hypothetical protein